MRRARAKERWGGGGSVDKPWREVDVLRRLRKGYRAGGQTFGEDEAQDLWRQAAYPGFVTVADDIDVREGA